jgi:hypothetical protein
MSWGLLGGRFSVVATRAPLPSRPCVVAPSLHASSMVVACYQHGSTTLSHVGVVGLQLAFNRYPPPVTARGSDAMLKSSWTAGGCRSGATPPICCAHQGLMLPYQRCWRCTRGTTSGHMCQANNTNVDDIVCMPEFPTWTARTQQCP